MANEKVFQSRIQLKHDIEENWSKATNFIPKVGEIIIYDIDENNSIARFKIGDGITNINSLPFISHHEVISYLPQELTEEQQMQARENLGLYGTYNGYKTLYQSSYTGDKQYLNLSDIPSHIRVVISNRYDEILDERIYEEEHYYDFGADVTYYMYGGSNLPFYYNVTDGFFEIYPSNLPMKDDYGIYKIQITGTDANELIYRKISAEFLPEELNPDIVVRTTEQNFGYSEQHQARKNIGANEKRLRIIVQLGYDANYENVNASFNYSYHEILGSLQNSGAYQDEVSSQHLWTPTQYDAIVQDSIFGGTKLTICSDIRHMNQPDPLTFVGTNFKENKKIIITLNSNDEITCKIEKLQEYTHGIDGELVVYFDQEITENGVIDLNLNQINSYSEDWSDELKQEYLFESIIIDANNIEYKAVIGNLYSIVSNEDGTKTYSHILKNQSGDFPCSISASITGNNYSILEGVTTANIAFDSTVALPATVRLQKDTRVWNKIDPKFIDDTEIQEKVDKKINALDHVKYTKQSLTEDQQMQARMNQGLYGAKDTLLETGGLAFNENKIADICFGGINNTSCNGKYCKLVLKKDNINIECYGTVEARIYSQAFLLLVNCSFTGKYDGQNFTASYECVEGSGGLTITEIYSSVESSFVSSTWNYELYSVEQNFIPEKYIPDAIARVADVETSLATKLTIPGTASVGQLIKVSAVDEFGKVTATEGQNVAYEDEALDLLYEMKIIEPIAAEDGKVLTLESGEILLL